MDDAPFAYDLLVVLGPTACGKTAAATTLARELHAEIISADSRQVYRGLDIGTGKDLHAYTAGGSPVPYHLIDIVPPTDEYNLFRFQRDFYQAYAGIRARNRLPLLCGGTGMYLSAVLQNYRLAPVDFSGSRYAGLLAMPEQELKALLLQVKPAMHSTTDLATKERMAKAVLIAETRALATEHPPLRALTIGIFPPRDVVRRRITERLHERLAAGMVAEVERLRHEGVTREKMEFFGLEYRFINRYLEGELTYTDMVNALTHAIHDFSKRQMSWFRKMEREGVAIHHVSSANVAEFYDHITSVLQ